MPCIWGMWAETMSLRNLEIASAFYIGAALASMGCYASNYSCQGRTVNSNSGPPLCSLTLYGTGTCNGQDQLPLTGTNSGQGWQNPWEPFPIQIKGVAITTFQDPSKDLNQFEYIFAGNSYTPDIMAILGGYSQNQTVMFPGAGFPFPPIGTPGNNHVDLHVNCAGRGSYQIYYTLYYQQDE